MSYDSGSITGRITIEGNPAPNLEVALLPQPYRFREKAIATTRTADDGRYRFVGLPSGHYWLKVDARGYVNAINWDEEGPGRNISVADGATIENADLDLIRGGVIAGRIIDSHGSPVADQYVELAFENEYGRYCEDALGFYENDDEFRTDVNGEYRIYGIPPGRYFIMIDVDIAKATGAVRDFSSYQSGQVYDDCYFQKTYYPGVTDRALAEAIDVEQGTEIENLNMTVGKTLRSFKVSGRVVYFDTRQPVQHCHIQLGHESRGSYGSSYSTSGPSDTDQDGNFTVLGLVPGQFFVSAQFEGETDFYCAPVEFEIKDDDITGLEIKAQRGLTLSGAVSTEESNGPELATRLAELKLHAESYRSDRCGHDSREAAVNSDGSFIIRGLPPGQVKVSLGYEEVSKYFSIVRIEYPDAVGEVRALPATTVWHPWDTPSIPLKEEGLKGMRIVLLYHSGSIRGHVDITRGKLDSSTRLGAPISWYEGGGHWSTSMEVDANGNFFMDGLEPGEYAISIVDSMGDLSETKSVIVNKDSETVVSFVIDLSRKREEEPSPRPFIQLVTNPLD